jgi:hypothetical protein
MREGCLVRESLNYTPITGPPGIECIVLQIKTKTSHLTGTNVYISPDERFDQNDLKPLFKPKAVIVGDLNSKCKIWGSIHSDARGRTIVELMEENDYCCINDGQPSSPSEMVREHTLTQFVTKQEDTLHIANGMYVM